MILYTRLMRNNSVNVFIPQRLVYIMYLAAAEAMVSGGFGGEEAVVNVYRVLSNYLDERSGVSV